jgi:hypothetical protein
MLPVPWRAGAKLDDFCALAHPRYTYFIEVRDATPRAIHRVLHVLCGTPIKPAKLT